MNTIPPDDTSSRDTSPRDETLPGTSPRTEVPSRPGTPDSSVVGSTAADGSLPGGSLDDVHPSEGLPEGTAPDRAAPDGFIADDTVHSLDPRHLLVLRVKAFLSAGLSLAPAGIGAFVLVLFTDIEAPWDSLLGVAWILLAVFLILRAVFWPKRVHERYRYLLNQTRIQIRRGVFWREIIDIPRSRIQHTDIKEGPIERQFELSSLVIYTAGTTSASVTIEGLTRERAVELRNFLVETRLDDAV